jgi:hypothetical protein
MVLALVKQKILPSRAITRNFVSRTYRTHIVTNAHKYKHIFGPWREQVTKDEERLHNELLHNLQSSQVL